MVASGSGPEIAKFVVFALPRSWQTAIRGKLFRKLYAEIYSQTAFLDCQSWADFATRLFYFSNRIGSVLVCSNPRCPSFGKPVCKLVQANRDPRLPLYCSNQCTQLASETVQKANATKAANGNSNREVAIRMAAAGKCSFLAPGAAEKTKQMLAARYGIDHPMKSPRVKEGMRKRCLEKRGVEFSSQDPAVAKSQRAKKHVWRGISFDSLIEVAYAKWLDSIGADWKRCEKAILYKHAGKLHFWLPDFEVDGKLVEVKGGHFFEPDGKMCNPYDSSQDELYRAKQLCMESAGAVVVRTDSPEFRAILEASKNAPAG